jgi:predicted dehydrogenase
MTVRTVLVGCGHVARHHLGGSRHAERLVYTGAFDTDTARAAALALNYSVPQVYNSWSEVLADGEVDAVDLCLPHHLHHPLALEALAAGKNVLVEKPLATMTEHAAEMVEAATLAGRVLMPVHNRVFVPTLRRLKELAVGGALGDVYLIKTLGIEPPQTVGVRPWLNRQQFGGGVTLAQTIHFAYLCRYYMGDVRRVTSMHGRRMLTAMEAEDTAIILLQFVSGSVGEMTSTFVQEGGGHEHRVTIYGHGGVATATHDRLQVTSEVLYGDRQPHDEVLADRIDYDAEFGGVLRDFAQAIEEGTPPTVSAMDGLRAVEIIDAAARAARDRCVVDLPLTG